MRYWLSALDLGGLTGISRQKAHRAIALGHTGIPWRGAILITRTIHGRGGRSGLQYQVRVDSLPIDLQRRFEEAFKQAPMN